MAAVDFIATRAAVFTAELLVPGIGWVLGAASLAYALHDYIGLWKRKSLKFLFLFNQINF